MMKNVPIFIHTEITLDFFLFFAVGNQHLVSLSNLLFSIWMLWISMCQKVSNSLWRIFLLTDLAVIVFSLWYKNTIVLKLWLFHFITTITKPLRQVLNSNSNNDKNGPFITASPCIRTASYSIKILKCQAW